MKILQELLNQEIMLFRAALDTERRKRRAIMGADGKRLNELTAKTELFLTEARSIEDQREAAVRALIDRYGIQDRYETLTLRRLVRLVETEAPAESIGLKDAAEEFRSTVFALKRESAENNRLMADTRNRIHDLLTGISDPAEEDKTYNPTNSATAKKQQGSAKALLLNANA